MASVRSRQQKRKTERAPAVWRGDALPKPVVTTERATIDHSVQRKVGVSWRVVSGFVVICMIALLFIMFQTDFFKVRTVNVVGATYIDPSEIFRYTDIAGLSIFLVDPNSVRQSILNSSRLIADARVTIGWPPEMVKIIIEERKPALVWTQYDIRVLLDLQGNILRQPREEEVFPNLIHVIADQSLNEPPLPENPIPLDVVSGALQLRQVLGGIEILQYNTAKGLGFRESSWNVWLGTGTDMPNKLLIYEALRDNLLGRGITPVEINVADTRAVYYCSDLEICDE
jgi:hypothetical protein